MKPFDILLKHALAAREKAYAPYSQFKVGACIKTDFDNYYAGCNVENAAYGLTQCAEGTAICNMVLDKVQNITDVLVVGETKTYLTPCGACRQKVREFGQADTQIHFCDSQKIIKTMTLATLLPESFGPEFLND